MPNVVEFLNKLWKSGVGALGQITKPQTLLNAVKMMVMAVPDDRGNDETMIDGQGG